MPPPEADRFGLGYACRASESEMAESETKMVFTRYLLAHLLTDDLTALEAMGLDQVTGNFLRGDVSTKSEYGRMEPKPS